MVTKTNGQTAPSNAALTGLGPAPSNRDARHPESRRGALVALPAVGVLVVAVGLRLAGGGALLDFLLQPETLVGLLVLNVLLAGYHVLAILDAYGLAVRTHPTPPRAGRACP